MYKNRYLPAIIAMMALLTACGNPAGSEKEPVRFYQPVEVGGIKQMVKITGPDKSAPILLFLHGGGGNSYSLIARDSIYNTKLKEHFITVLWDQREYGETFQLNESPDSITLDLMAEDTRQLVNYLRSRFDQEMVYLAGHSMGTALAVRLAESSPDLLKGIFLISPVVNGIESQCIALERLREYFKQQDNERAVNELATVECPAANFDQQFVQYVWQTEFEGEHVTDEMREAGKPILEKMMKKSAGLVRAVNEMNFLEKYASLDVPVIILSGSNDYVSNDSLSRKYFDKLDAPYKQFYSFDESGHNVPETDPERMQEILISELNKIEMAGNREED